MNTRTDEPTVIEIFFEAEKAKLVRTKHRRVETAFIFDLFCFGAWSESEERKESLFHHRHGCKATLAGEALKRLRFERGVVDAIAVETAAGKLVSKKLLRLSFFALTDLGAIIVSMYPQMAGLSREMVMFSSHHPKQVALAQHFAATWMAEVYFRMKSAQ